MIKQLLLPLIGVALFIVIVGVFTQKSSSINWPKYLPVASSALQKTMTIGTKTIQVEIANSPDSRAKGLGGRSQLPPDSGMLFAFDTKPASPTPIFWMKDMLIPLDMIWISGSKVVTIDKNIPVPQAGTQDSSLQTFSARGSIDYVLEVNGGFSDTNNIKVGDSVTLPTL